MSEGRHRFPAIVRASLGRRPWWLAACWLVSSAAAHAQGGMMPVWSDEFSGSNGAVPDPSNWTYDTGAGGWGNNELQNYTTRPDNARVENGVLVIEARRESYNGSPWTSARLKSQGLRTFKYGRIEFRAKLPGGQGPWPALWMLGNNINSAGWPACGEIDVMEWRNNNPSTIYQTLHAPSFHGETARGLGTGASNPSTQFHTYAVDWTAGQVTFRIDGNVTGTLSTADTGSPFEKDFFLIMNVAVGGNFVSNQVDASLATARMEVDYVRVFQEFPVNPAVMNGGFESALADGVFPGWQMQGTDAGGGLTNAGWENAMAGWLSWPNDGTLSATAATTGDNYYLSPLTFTAGTGSRALKMWGQYWSGQSYGLSYQDMPAAAGQSFSLNGSGFNPPADSMGTGNEARLFIKYMDASYNQLGATRVSAAIASTTPRNAWTPLEVPLSTAPAGTAHVQAGVQFFQPASHPNGSAYFDDLVVVKSGVNSARTISAAAEGASAARLEVVPGTPIRLKQTLACAPGKLWRLDCQVRTPASAPLAAGSGFTGTLEFLNANGAPLQTTSAATVPGAAYATFTVEDSSPPGTCYTSVGYELTGSGSLDLDAVTLVEISALPGQLFNGGFEIYDGTAFHSWNRLGTAGTLETEASGIHGGRRAVRTGGSGQAPSNIQGWQQTVAAVASKRYAAAVWARPAAGQSLVGNNRGFIRLQFLDSEGTPLLTGEKTTVTAGSPSTFTLASLSRTAPPMTSQLRISLLFEQTNGAAGAVDFDDASLAEQSLTDYLVESGGTSLPPSSTIATADPDGDGYTNGQEFAWGSDPLNAVSRPLARLSPNGTGSLMLSWIGSPGVAYRILTTTDLNRWDPGIPGSPASFFGPVVVPTSTDPSAVSVTVETAIPLTNPEIARFYRVKTGD